MGPEKCLVLFIAIRMYTFSDSRVYYVASENLLTMTHLLLVGCEMYFSSIECLRCSWRSDMLLYYSVK